MAIYDRSDTVVKTVKLYYVFVKLGFKSCPYHYGDWSKFREFKIRIEKHIP